MKIRSEGKQSSAFGRYFISVINYLSGSMAALYILAMSYEYMPAEPIHVLYIGVIKLIITNIFYSTATKEDLQAFTDNPLRTSLTKHMILAPVGILLGFAMLFTLLTGNMVGWYWYIMMNLGAVVISKVHMNWKGVKPKSN